MSTRSLRLRTIATMVALGFLLGGAVQPSFAGSPDDKAPKKQKRELDDVFKRWLKEDVVYIISPEERDAFLKLATDEEREQFIDQFWLRRDPDPDTPENSVREEHYRRIAYANEKFTSGKPGWRTDRGRIYIAWGKPDETESYPTGQVYDRPQWQGGGSTTTYAYEVWWYRHLDGVGDDIEIEFIDPSGSGEYRIANNPYEKDALTYVANAGATDWEQLGLSNRTDRPIYGGNGGRYYNPPANKTQFALLEQRALLFKGPGANQSFDDLKLTALDPTIEANALPFTVRTDFYRVSGKDVATALTLQIDHSDLAFQNSGGVYSATVNVQGRLTQLSGKNAGYFQEVISTPRYSDENIALGEQQKSVFQKNVLLSPGRYKVDFVARDVTSGKTGIVTQSFVVPRYAETKLSTSSVVLATKIEVSGPKSATPQFIIGKFKVVPNVSNTYKVGQPINVFLQVYDAEMDQTTLKPALDIEYVLLLNGKEIKRVSWSDSDKLSDLSGSQLAIGEIIPTDGLAAGTYTLQVRVTDRVAQKSLDPQIEVTLVP